MDLASPGQGVVSSATLRFRALLCQFLSPDEEARLLGYREGEAQLSLERPGQPARFIVLIDGSHEEERSLRLRMGRLATEKVDNQHIVVVANHSWMPDSLRKLEKEFWPKMDLYQLNSDGNLELKAKKPLKPLMARLRVQPGTPLPQNESEAEFAARCTQAEAAKTRLREEYADRIKYRSTPVTFVLFLMQAAMLGLCRLAPDNTSGLVQLGAVVPPFVHDGEWWRLFCSTLLHVSLVSAVLSGLVLLSIGTLLEKLLGSARFLSLYLLSGLCGGLVALFFPRSLVVISVGASGALCGLLGAGGVLALDPGSLPAAEVVRLRKIAIGGLVTTALLTLLPGVDRLTHLGGVVAGAVLMASSALRPPVMRASSDGRLMEPALPTWLHRGLAAFLGLLLFGSVGFALWHGPVQHKDADWKKRLAAAKGAQRQHPATSGVAAAATADKPGEPAAAAEGAALVRRPLGDSGASLELPASLGEAHEKTEPGRQAVYEFGDLGEKQQQLMVLFQRNPRPIKRKAQLDELFSQAVIQLKADKMRDDRVTVLTPPARSTLDGWPLMEFHVRAEETVQARGVVQARTSGVIVLWYVFTDLLPESSQVDLKQAVHSLRDGNSNDAGAKKAPKRRR